MAKVYHIRFSVDGSYFLAGAGQALHVYEARSGNEVLVITLPGYIGALDVIQSKNSTLALVHADRGLDVFEIPSGTRTGGLSLDDLTSLGLNYRTISEPHLLSDAAVVMDVSSTDPHSGLFDGLTVVNMDTKTLGLVCRGIDHPVYGIAVVRNRGLLLARCGQLDPERMDESLQLWKLPEDVYKR